MSDEVTKSRRDTKNVGSYILGETLGEGAFGKVKVGNHIQTNEKCAIKILDKEKMEDEEDIIRVQREISILKKLRHKNLPAGSRGLRQARPRVRRQGPQRHHCLSRLATHRREDAPADRPPRAHGDSAERSLCTPRRDRQGEAGFRARE